MLDRQMIFMRFCWKGRQGPACQGRFPKVFPKKALRASSFDNTTERSPSQKTRHDADDNPSKATQDIPFRLKNCFKRTPTSRPRYQIILVEIPMHVTSMHSATPRIYYPLLELIDFIMCRSTCMLLCSESGGACSTSSCMLTRACTCTCTCTCTHTYTLYS